MSKPPPTSELSTPMYVAILGLSCPEDDEDVFFPDEIRSDDAHSDTEQESGSHGVEQKPEDGDSELVFSSVDLPDVFNQMGWGCLRGYMCFDHIVRAGDFNVTDVYEDILDQWSSVHCDDVL